MIALSQFYFQYWSIKRNFVYLVLSNSSKDGQFPVQNEPLFDWSIYIFTAAFFYVSYAVPLGSDWIYYRRKAQMVPKSFRLACFQNLLLCVRINYYIYKRSDYRIM